MATPTVRFPWVPGLSVPSARIAKIADDTVHYTAASCTERASAPGIYEAVFTNPSAGDYYITPIDSGVDQDGVGTVFNLQNDSGTYLESSLLPPGQATISDDDINAIAAATRTALSGYTVNIVQPIDQSGNIEIKQGDSYIDSRSLPFRMTGSLPALNSDFTFLLYYGVGTLTITGTIDVISSTEYLLLVPLTEEQTALLPEGLQTFEIQVTFDGTSHPWTPFSGTCNVLAEIG